MDVSIILPTFNNAKMLATTLAAFEQVQFPQTAELIVVDNNSRDDTAKVVESFTPRLPIRYAFEPNKGVSAAKNCGLRMAKGRLLIFTDDDVRPGPVWLTTYLSAYRKNTEGFIWGGPVVSEFEGPMPDPRLLRFAPYSVKGLDLGDRERVLDDHEWFIGANWGCPAEAMSRVGPFNEAIGPYPGATVVLAGEETEMQRRFRAAGYKSMYLPATTLRHVVPARKCTLEHAANRAEAGGRLARAMAPVERGVGTLYGVPLWCYRKCAERWLLAWIKRISGRDWYPDYISYRADLGFLKGMPSNRKAAGNKPI
jgi:GT2 family glycosyltransferase